MVPSVCVRGYRAGICSRGLRVESKDLRLLEGLLLQTFRAIRRSSEVCTFACLHWHTIKVPRCAGHKRQKTHSLIGESLGILEKFARILALVPQPPLVPHQALAGRLHCCPSCLLVLKAPAYTESHLCDLLLEDTDTDQAALVR